MTDSEIRQRITLKKEKGRKNYSFVPEGEKIVCRAPVKTTEEDLLRLIGAHRRALTNLIKRSDALNEAAKAEPPLSESELNCLYAEAQKVIPPIVRHYAGIMGVLFGRITIRCQKTRWGSCSSKNNLNFNCLLMLMTPYEIEYVVVHELAHLKELNHSPAFWAEVERVLPDYAERRRSLKEKGEQIMLRNHRQKP